jgi:DNA-binding winged helix-turn-helix (wHTH) protein
MMKIENKYLIGGLFVYSHENRSIYRIDGIPCGVENAASAWKKAVVYRPTPRINNVLGLLCYAGDKGVHRDELMALWAENVDYYENRKIVTILSNIRSLLNPAKANFSLSIDRDKKIYTLSGVTVYEEGKN